MLSARPQMNGNEAGDFRKAARTLIDAQDALEDAIRFVSMNVTHGRNYQHLENADAARNVDLEAVDELRKAYTHMRELTDAIVSASNG